MVFYFGRYDISCDKNLNLPGGWKNVGLISMLQHIDTFFWKFFSINLPKQWLEAKMANKIKSSNSSCTFLTSVRLTFVWALKYGHKNIWMVTQKLMHMYGLTITQRTHSLLTLNIHNDWGRHTLPHKHVKLFICWPILIEAASPVRWGSPSASLLLPFFLLLLFMSLQIVSTQSFVLYPPPSRFCIGWAEPTFLIVHLQEIQSSHQTWPPRPIYPCSLLFFSLTFSFLLCTSSSSLCSSAHWVWRTEGWDLRVMLSEDFDQEES